MGLEWDMAFDVSDRVCGSRWWERTGAITGRVVSRERLRQQLVGEELQSKEREG